MSVFIMLAKFVNGDNIDNVDIIENVVAFGKSDKNIRHLITSMVLRDASASKNSLRQYFFLERTGRSIKTLHLRIHPICPHLVWCSNICDFILHITPLLLLHYS